MGVSRKAVFKILLKPLRVVPGRSAGLALPSEVSDRAQVPGMCHTCVWLDTMAQLVLGPQGHILH